MNAYINALYKFEFEMDRFITLPDGLQQRIADVVLTIEEFPRKGSALYPQRSRKWTHYCSLVRTHSVRRAL